MLGAKRPRGMSHTALSYSAGGPVTRRHVCPSSTLTPQPLTPPAPGRPPPATR